MSRCGTVRRGRVGTRQRPKERIVDLVANRRVRVTARSRRNEGFPAETLSSILRWQHPFQIEDTNWHRSEQLHERVRMEAGRVGGCEVRGGHQDQAPPGGRRSAVLVDPTKKNLSYRKRNLGRSRASRWSAISMRGHPANKTPLDTGRPSHGSRDREGAVFNRLLRPENR